jgi:hypothetical protein
MYEGNFLFFLVSDHLGYIMISFIISPPMADSLRKTVTLYIK